MEQAEFLEHLLRERQMLHAFIFSLLRDRHLTEDIFQDVSLIAFRKCAEFQSGTNFGAWLRGIARRRIMKEWEKPGRNVVALDEAALDALMQAYERAAPEAWDDRQAALDDCLKQLPPNARSIVESRYRDELGFAELARRFESTVNSIQVRLFKLRQALRRCVEVKLAETGIKPRMNADERG